MQLKRLIKQLDGKLIPTNTLKSKDHQELFFITAFVNVLYSIFRSQLRTTILGLACSLDMAECLKEAGSRFDDWLVSPQTKIPSPDLRNLVYYYGMANVGNEAKWNQMWTIYKQETDAQEKAKLMYGLSGVQVPWILSKLIKRKTIF